LALRALCVRVCFLHAIAGFFLAIVSKSLLSKKLCISVVVNREQKETLGEVLLFSEVKPSVTRGGTSISGGETLCVE
jgi:hypothetical protein